MSSRVEQRRAAATASEYVAGSSPAPAGLEIAPAALYSLRATSLPDKMQLTPQHRRTLRTLAVTLAFVWLGWLVYALLQQVSGLLTLREFEPAPMRSVVVITLYYWLPWVVLAPFVAMCSARFPVRPDSWARPLAAHVLLLLTLAFAHALAIALLYHYSGGATGAMQGYAPWQHTGHFLFGDDMLLFDSVTYAVLAATLNIRNFQRIVRRQELDASRLSQRLAELRLQTLRMQVNPHFLFNALNAIAVLVKKGENARAESNIRLLSRFFRQTLESSDQHWVSLEDELEMVRQYVAIAKLRFGDRLEIREDYEPAARRAIVPAMLLQPLVENAVTHAFEHKLAGCELSLACRVEDARLRIEITDNGVGGRFYSDPDFKEGTGLANVRGRLEQMYGREHTFTLTSGLGSGTRISIDLPLSPPAADAASAAATRAAV